MTTKPRSMYAQCLGLELHYLAWGPEEGPAVIAWHGLTRNCHDMDELAAYLSQRYRVICPDTIGRGLSQWSDQPDEHYRLEFYARQTESLCQQLGIEELYWVGTSMGGALAMYCASGLIEAKLKQRMRAVVLNDMAPELSPDGLSRIASYASAKPVFNTMSEAIAFYRQTYASFGQMSDQQWCRLAENSVRRLSDGRFSPSYDGRLLSGFGRREGDLSLWEHYDNISSPVLCLRGQQSDLISPEVVTQMSQRGPGRWQRFEAIEVPDCGHAPALNTEQQWQWIDKFFSRY